MMIFRRRTAILGALVALATASMVVADDPDYPNCTDHPSKQSWYDVVVTELNAVRNDGASLISRTNGSSDFRFNFNVAWFPGRPEEGLVVRLVDQDLHPEWANAGAMAVVPVHWNLTHKPLSAQRVTEKMITWAGDPKPGPAANKVWGAADPRVTYRPHNRLHYLTWDNCTKNCWPQRITYLSTTTDPFDPHSWTFHGGAFPFPYTSGAALLFRDDAPESAPHLAFVCNSNTADTIFIAESDDGLVWRIPLDPSRRVLMKGRPGCWDAQGIAAGPQPERLSTGDYLLIYNIDTGWPYCPNPLGRCAIGWAILDGNDPTQIVARSRRPLLTATLPWERCNEKHDAADCQVAMVVFASGLKPIPDTDNEFLVIYGGADAVVAVSKIKVNVKRGERPVVAAT